MVKRIRPSARYVCRGVACAAIALLALSCSSSSTRESGTGGGSGTGATSGSGGTSNTGGTSGGGTGGGASGTGGAGSIAMGICLEANAAFEACGIDTGLDPCAGMEDATLPELCTMMCMADTNCEAMNAMANGDIYTAFELDPFLSECSMGCVSWTCASGEEIVQAWVCDGEEDCADGSDEAECM
jgi:hypothetical protein